MITEPKVESVVLKGMLHFIGDPTSTFMGPFKKGMRPIVWYENLNREATSCHLLSDVEIYKGQTKEVKLILLNQLQLGIPITRGIVLSIGNTLHKLAEFTVEENLGLWEKGNFNE